MAKTVKEEKPKKERAAKYEDKLKINKVVHRRGTLEMYLKTHLLEISR